ncbi:MAG: TlpA family protein disulfide reductase [Planctomycetes bacterium]|nr:TlpA family protein disulfide reductase [Planctomycetota bacterium]
MVLGCDNRNDTTTAAADSAGSTSETKGSDPDPEPDDIPRFANNSPFAVEYESPIPKEGKRLWARSVLWGKAPELVVENWIGDEPDTDGKYMLIEIWATWCSQCRKATPLLNEFHKKYGEDLVVIGISDEPEAKVRQYADENIDYYTAVDTQGRMKKELGVSGIPHVIIVEPGGSVVWEGFPLLAEYELTGDTIENIIKVAAKL